MIYSAKDEHGGESTPAEVLLGVGKSRLQNPFLNLDVNRDEVIAASDAVLVINLLNDVETSRLVEDLPVDAMDLDVNGDGIITAADALLVINFLNQRNEGEGETKVMPHTSMQPATLNDYFFDSYQASEEVERRSKGRRTRVS